MVFDSSLKSSYSNKIMIGLQISSHNDKKKKRKNRKQRNAKETTQLNCNFKDVTSCLKIPIKRNSV